MTSAAAAPDVEDGAVAEAVVQVSGMLERVFAAAQETREQTTDLLLRARARDRPPVTNDLARLQPLLRRQLARHAGLISGTGFVAAPGLLADVPAWLEWWQTRADGRVEPMLLDLDPATSAYSDYTHWDWYALPRDTGERAVSGPYVDYLCSDEYSLTLAVPVLLDGTLFAGVAAADVYLRHFQAAVGPALHALRGPRTWSIPRPRRRLNSPAHLAGSLVRDLDGASARAELRLHRCGEIPLTLVTRP